MSDRDELTALRRLSELEAKAGVKPSPQDGPTLMQKVQSSAPLRIIQGLRDPIDAGAQFLSNVIPEGVTDALDYFPKKLRESDNPTISGLANAYLADPRPEAINRQLRETEQQYQESRQATAPKTLSGQITGVNDPGADMGRFFGNVTSPVNAVFAAATPVKALTTVPRMVGTGTLLGTAGGALTPVTNENEQKDFGTTKAIQMGMGGTTGAVLTPVFGKVIQAAAPSVERFINNLTGKTEITLSRASLETDRILKQALDDVGHTIDDIPKAQYEALRQQVNDSLRGGKKLDAAALMRKQDFNELGIPSTLGQITRDPTQFARERNLRGVSGVGDPLMQRFDLQNQGLQRGIGAYSKNASENFTAGEKLAAALRGKDETMRKGVTAAYTEARNSSGKELNIPAQGLAQDAAQIIEDFADKVPSAIRNKLDSYGMLSGGNQTKVFTFSEAEKLLQSINEHVGADRATNTALGRLRDSVKKSILESGGDDVFSPARSAAAERFKLQDAVPALKAVVDGKASPDSFIRKFVINGNTVEVKTLAKLLRETSPEAYQEARAQVGAHIQRAAFGENVTADKLISPERLAKALRDMGTEKLSAFFEPAEIAAMKRMSRVGAYINTTPSAAAVNTSGTAAAAMNLAGQVPGISSTAAVVKAIGMPILKNRAVNNAMASNVPEFAAQASPEFIRRARLAAALAGVGAGGAVAPR
jgi:hypothetical protein